MTRTVVATDDFNRAGPALGSDWANLMTALRGDVTINTSIRTVGGFSASGNNHPMARWVGVGTFTDDQYAEVELVGLSFLTAAIRVGVMVRQGAGVGASATGYEAYICLDGSSNRTTVLAMRNGATFTTLHSASVAWTSGDLLSLEVEGTTLRLCKNGTPLGGLFTQTDATHSTGQPGIITTASVYGDNWVAGSIAAAGGSSFAARRTSNLLGARAGSRSI